MATVSELGVLSPLNEECLRFEKVMQAQAQPRMLVSLFDKLVVSVKFSDEAKPLCFGLLIQECGSQVSDRLVSTLLEAIERTGAAALMRQVYSEYEADEMVRKTVRRAVEGAGKDADKLLEVLRFIEESKLAKDRAHALDLLIKAGMAEDVVGEICDLTFHGYYGIYQPKTQPLFEIDDESIPF